MPKNLVIVESPTKARTLARYLGPDYVVASSVGHVRDLPASAAEIPPQYKRMAWARIGVDVEHDFKPLYVVPPDKKKTIAELRKALKQADRLLLATDEDREGEAISWHLVEVLKPRVPTERMVFHEITRRAIQESLGCTRDIDMHLVQAQEARRIIDRLYGYLVSPVLWRKIAPRLSAGRVQSVAIRMLVERERARMRFKPAAYWDLSAEFTTGAGDRFEARLVAVDGARVAAGRDFDPDTGTPREQGLAWLDRDAAAALRAELADAEFTVADVEETPFKRSPAPPFTTSTLQQEANRKLRFHARRTMRAAQRLYESGFITYMRTDSVNLSQEAIAESRAAVAAEFGEEYLPAQPRLYRTKVKNAQEAHEAIRPAGGVRPVEEVRRALGDDEARLYELIRKRTMASQMKDARGRRMTVRVGARGARHSVEFLARGSVLDFPGFLRAYVEGRVDPEAALADLDRLLPPVQRGERLLARLQEEEHTTSPPARLTEAGLVRALEESGIGRPSTYASIIDTIERREYTFRKGTALVPTFTAFAVVQLMERHFTHLVDTEFTARMENRLDRIARGEREPLPYLREFYFGNGMPGLRQLLERKLEDIDPREVCTVRLGEDDQGREIVVRVGRYGPFVQLGDPDPDRKTKPKMVSLLKGMSPAEVTLDVALRLLSLPRVVGVDDDGVEIVAANGRYGPYIKRGDDTRSLGEDDDLLTITRERALQLLAQEKKGRFRRTPKTLKVFDGVEALGGREVKVLDGRYGPYVTDGEVNASLPKDLADPTAITLEQALELLEKRRQAGPRRRSGRKKKRSSRSGS